MWVAWWLVLIAIAALLVAYRERVDKAQVALLFLLVVLGASAAGGRALGVGLSFAAFIIFDWSFLPPYGELIVRDPLDWLVLVVFLITSLVAAQLLNAARAQRAAVEREMAAHEAARFKDALLASVSHDLRTPLTSIKGLAHELAQDGDERAVIIEEEADRLNRMVTNLLDAARIGAGNYPVDQQPNALDDLLGAVVNQFAGRADRHRLVASLDHPDDLVIGRFDFVQTVRIVTNLVENAMRCSPVDTQVNLSGGAEGGAMVVRISDRGPGFTAGRGTNEAQNLVHGADRVGHTVSTGMGLSIARGLAEAQSGTVECHVRSGGGLTFTVALPLA